MGLEHFKAFWLETIFFKLAETLDFRLRHWELITWVDFCKKLNTEEMRAYLTAFELDASQAKAPWFLKMVNLVDLVFLGANDVGSKWCWLMEFSLEALLKNQLPVVLEQLLAHNAVSLCYGCQSIRQRELPFWEKMMRYVSRWGCFSQSHATTSLPKVVSLGLRCLKDGQRTCILGWGPKMTRQGCLLVVWLRCMVKSFLE